MIALWLELRLSKDEILARYLSSIYFRRRGLRPGRGGPALFRQARRSSLSIGEAAMLAGMVKAPVDLDPVDHPRRPARRPGWCWTPWCETKAITGQQADAAGHVTVRTHPGRPAGGRLFRRLDLAAGRSRPSTGPGYGEVRVPTTLDSRLQRIVERGGGQGHEGRGQGQGRPGRRGRHASGRAGSVAMLGGTNYRQTPFNRAVQAQRQPGSAFKLFVYLAALRDGATPDNLVIGDPVTIGGWTPANYEGGRRARPDDPRRLRPVQQRHRRARVYQQAGGPGGGAGRATWGSSRRCARTTPPWPWARPRPICWS